MNPELRVVTLSGGVGGARLLHGLSQVLEPEQLTAVVNTGDDFRHWGLWISPDLDTVMYTLAGVADDTRGWGLRRETYQTRTMMERYGAPTWFSLGDRDLATHLVRSEALKAGERLTTITARLCAAQGVGARVLPMADTPRQTHVDTPDGRLLFQQWFVQERCQPRVTGFHFEGTTQTTPEVVQALEAADLVLLGPSNPYVSIDPILTLDGVRDALLRRPVVAVTPIVGSRAVKGPLAEMIHGLGGQPASAASITSHYGALLDGFVLEREDAGRVTDLPVLATDTIMGGAEDRARLAREVLDFAESLL